jgi:hypothetical protein
MSDASYIIGIQALSILRLHVLSVRHNLTIVGFVVTGCEAVPYDKANVNGQTKVF